LGGKVRVFYGGYGARVEFCLIVGGLDAGLGRGVSLVEWFGFEEIGDGGFRLSGGAL